MNELADTLPWLIAGVLVIAVLYSSVGHAGASGYIAVMSLLAVAPATIKPVALMLNVAVALIGTTQFYRAGHFRWPLFWPFAVVAVPAAALGGYLQLPAETFKLLVGLALLLSAANLLLRAPADGPTQAPPLFVALAVGGVLGLLAGLTGTGGGIYLTPLMLFLRWAPMRQVAAVSAPFILLNSASGLAGHLMAGKIVPALTWPLLSAVVVGGALGATLGALYLPVPVIKRVLALVLLIAAVKLLGLI
ncbi:MAG: sulfite exporter TauE/SafE family protein [Stagnimonas sp.]|nr:sulfite exporter TauE/SafE family protein [Stagnimonas sp.]